ncbi:MAG TPA: hypothetical protein VKB41_11075, partial [Steroidobacteraceae bacterium]|nr:hypothetical protein [Steroidobacteraceae bacterium]
MISTDCKRHDGHAFTGAHRAPWYLPVFLVWGLAQSANANADLVAAYAFDEGTGTTVVDASGTGNTGTASNTTWTTSGKNGSALVFNGS